MASGIVPQIATAGDCHILFDSRVLEQPAPELFCAETLAARGLVQGWAQGRAGACFFRWQTEDWVLRQFRRGGWVARVVEDTYLGFRAESSRSWREWRLLAELQGRDLPVPRPVAAAAFMRLGRYRAFLITTRIGEGRPLGEMLRERPLSRGTWDSIGRCLGRFHAQGVCHADLNANNILLDAHGRVHLIDFDRCQIRSSQWWKNLNLKRLRRSLAKLQQRWGTFHFQENDWQNLWHGYRSASEAHPAPTGRDGGLDRESSPAGGQAKPGR